MVKFVRVGTSRNQFDEIKVNLASNTIQDLSIETLNSEINPENLDDEFFSLIKSNTSLSSVDICALPIEMDLYDEERNEYGWELPEKQFYSLMESLIARKRPLSKLSLTRMGIASNTIPFLVNLLQNIQVTELDLSWKVETINDKNLKELSKGLAFQHQVKHLVLDNMSFTAKQITSLFTSIKHYTKLQILTMSHARNIDASLVFELFQNNKSLYHFVGLLESHEISNTEKKKLLNQLLDNELKFNSGMRTYGEDDWTNLYRYTLFAQQKQCPKKIPEKMEKGYVTFQFS